MILNCHTEVSNDVIIWYENEKELNIRISAGMYTSSDMGIMYRPIIYVLCTRTLASMYNKRRYNTNCYAGGRHILESIGAVTILERSLNRIGSGGVQVSPAKYRPSREIEI